MHLRALDSIPFIAGGTIELAISIIY